MNTVRKTAAVVGVCATALCVQFQLAGQAAAVPSPLAPKAAGKKMPPPPPEEARVLDLSGPMPIVIDEPGYYRLDRDWDPDHQGEPGPFLDIRANNVTLDFRGYSISVQNEGPAILVTGSFVSLRGGSVSGFDDQGFSLSIQGSNAHIENLRVAGQNASVFGGSTITDAVVRDSELLTGILGLPAGSTLEGNTFRCAAPECGVAISDDTRVVANVWEDFFDNPALVVMGDGNLIERNTFGPSNRTSTLVEGRSNLLRANTFQVDGFSGPVLQISNGANVLEANVVLPTPEGERAGVGIRFTADGNAFGNNRLGALVPVEVGPTVQTDWGGNVGF